MCVYKTAFENCECYYACWCMYRSLNVCQDAFSKHYRVTCFFFPDMSPRVLFNMKVSWICLCIRCWISSMGQILSKSRGVHNNIAWVSRDQSLSSRYSLHLAVGSSRANSSRNSELFQVHVMENIHVETSIKFMQLFKILQWTYELKMLLFSGEKKKSC